MLHTGTISVLLRVRCCEALKTPLVGVLRRNPAITQLLAVTSSLSPPPSPAPQPPEVSRKLVVSLRDTDCVPAGVIRAYVSELYQEVYDAACAASRPDLDVRVLLPSLGASGCAGSAAANGDASAAGSAAAGSAPSPFTFNHGPPPPESYGGGGGSGQPHLEGRDFTVNLVNGWATREVAELEPRLEVLFSDEPRGSDRVETINAGRRLAGYPELKFFSLDSVAGRAYKAEYFYAEDVRADIPTFSSVSGAAPIRQRSRSLWFKCSNRVV